MHNHTGCLVDHNHSIIFIKDVEGNVFGDKLEFMMRVREDNGNHVGRLDPVIWIYRSSVYQDVPGPGSLLYLIARYALQPVAQEFINAQQGLSPVYHNAVMFIQF